MTKETLFEEAVKDIIEREGGYSDYADDPGGKTRYGITEKTAREHGYTGPMDHLPLELAVDIYKKSYWLDLFEELHPAISFELFDSTILHGRQATIRMAQRVMHVKVDGILGPQTTEALRDINPLRFVLHFNAQRLHFISDLSTFAVFGRGWVRRLAKNLAAAPWTGSQN